MKKILFAVAAFFFMAGTAMAQLPLSKGNLFVNADVSNVDISFGDNTTFTLGANGGYFLADKLALIGGIDFYTTKDFNMFGINVGARYYFLEQTKGSFFASGLLGVDKIKNVDATFGLTIDAGYAYFLNQHVALEPKLTLWLPFSKDYDTTFSIGAAISVYF